jgi:hypothetical protein
VILLCALSIRQRGDGCCEGFVSEGVGWFGLWLEMLVVRSVLCRCAAVRNDGSDGRKREAGLLGCFHEDGEIQ